MPRVNGKSAGHAEVANVVDVKVGGRDDIRQLEVGKRGVALLTGAIFAMDFARGPLAQRSRASRIAASVGSSPAATASPLALACNSSRCRRLRG